MQWISRSLAALLLSQPTICLGAEEPPARGLFVDHFMEEALWVASTLKLNIGDDTGPLRGWAARGTDAQKGNKAAVVSIVNYCARQAFAQVGEIPRELENFPSQAAAARDSYNRAALTAWRLCEGTEADAYRNVILRGALAGVDQQIVKACTAIPDRDSYAAIERCVNAELQIRK